MIGDKSYTDSVLIRDGRRFGYIHHTPHAVITNGVASFTIYKKGEATLFEEVAYRPK